MKSSAAFLVGAFLGACAAVFISRVREEADREDEKSLYDRMDQRIKELEERTQSMRSTKSKPKA